MCEGERPFTGSTASGAELQGARQSVGSTTDRHNEVAQECRICGSTGPHECFVVREMMFGTRERFEYYFCGTCETLQIRNPLEGDELQRHYPEDYYSYNARRLWPLRWLIGQRDRKKLHAGGGLVGALLTRRVLDGILRVHLGGDVVGILAHLQLKPDARILDVGCGGGALLDRLAMVGFTNLSGVDPFISADGRSPRGVPLTKGDLSEVRGEFDLVMFNHSLEHVPDPIAALKAAAERLAPDGICLARTPTTSSEAWTTYRADWVQIDAPRHFVVPSRQAMELAAERAGLRVEHMFDDSNLGQFAGSEAYRRGVAVTDPKISGLFSPKQLWEWGKRADRLNQLGRGDQVGFVMRAR